MGQQLQVGPLIKTSDLVADASDAFKALHALCFDDSPERPWGIDHVRSIFGMGGMYLLPLNLRSRMIGFLLCRCVLPEAEVISLGVLPAYRGQGLGAQLINGFIQSSINIGIREFHLEVRHTNSAAIALYRSIGFQETGTRKSYYLLKDGSRCDAKQFVYRVSDID